MVATVGIEIRRGLVSTVVPVYNRAEMVEACIQSVLEQTYRPIELVLVDDGSTDDTLRVLEDWRQRYPNTIRVLGQANAGPGAARNAGLGASNGEFIQYLDSDDLLHPEKFEWQVDSLIRNPQADVSYCITERLNLKTGETRVWARTGEAIQDIFPSFLPKRGWATLTPLWRRSACDAIGPWKSLRVMEDWEHDLRAGILGLRPVRVPGVLCTVRDHEGDRASGMNEGFTPERMRDFFLAHESIWQLMKERGLIDWDYLGPFSRTMFWAGRECGRNGFRDEAERALAYTDEMTRLNGRPTVTRPFRRLKSALGWRVATPVAERAAAAARSVRAIFGRAR